jgi:non-ribosomal peptide synthetase component F
MRTASPRVSPAYVHELIGLMALRRPDAVAVVHTSGTLDFARLDELANRLAQHLRGSGVVAGSQVAVCLSPGPENLIAQLAVVKLGAAVVLLEPSYPETWLAFLLDSVEAQMLVTVTNTLERLALDRGFPVLLLDNDEWRAAPPTAPEVPVTDDTVCHVAYPGRPTGLPRPVLRTHGQLRAVVRGRLGQSGERPPAGTEPVDCLLTLATGAAVETVTVPAL